MNQTVNTVWDATDLTYVLRGTIVIAGAYDFTSTDAADSAAPVPNLHDVTPPSPTPTVSLTIQAALPGTLLADGETIPSPGQSVIVKLLNDNTPNDAGSPTWRSNYGSTGIAGRPERRGGLRRRRRRRRRSARPARSVDPGAYSELRILGIPGNQTTGQQRVPVIITSLRDDTVGTTVRGVVMDDICEQRPRSTRPIVKPGTTRPDHAGARRRRLSSTSAATR